MKTLRDLILPNYGITPHSIGFVTQQEFSQYMNQLLMNIDNLESSAVRVYGWQESDGTVGFGSKHARSNPKDDTHTALLICIEPLNRAVTIGEIVEALETIAAAKEVTHETWVETLAKRIKTHGVRSE